MLQVYVPAGEFLMGSAQTDSQADDNEKPQHMVYLDAFWIDKLEVTNGRYQKCVKSRSCTQPHSTDSTTRAHYYGNNVFDDYPVIYTDWNQAQAYCKWAGRRLPSEAEWEKAARGVDGRIFPWGDNLPRRDLVNSNRNIGDTTLSGSYQAGASLYGALDMAGNVWEWVNDWYDPAYYQQSPARNPTGPTSGIFPVLRGGSWYDIDRRIRATFRYWGPPTSGTGAIGFRCAVSASP